MNRPSTTRSQSGLDRLLVFLLAVVVIVLVTPYVLGFAGIDVRAPNADSTGGPAYDADHDLYVLGVRGGDVGDDRSSIGTVRVIVSPAAGREPAGLTTMSTVWVGDEAYDLAPAAAAREGADGTYLLRNPDSGDAVRVLEVSTDRAVLVFDVGTDDIPGAEQFGERLEPGDAVTLTIVTERGESLSRELTVPDPIPDGETVGL
ncbi:hypothetical protein ACKVMT_03315 [Halobacteriales archaeon Cl-PHB]